MATFDELEVLYEGPRTRVVRARGADGATVILKQVAGGWTDPASVDRLRREHDLLRLADAHGAPRAIALHLDDTPQLALEDHGAVALRDYLPTARAGARAALEIACHLTDAVAAVHARGVLHRDVNPANAIVRPDTREVWLIDFGLASPLPRRRTRAAPVATLEGTPAYLAPEQTSRMNRAVDARADLYSLGATLYELFGGRPPHEADDLIGYAHAHLAAEPPRLEPVVPDLPPATVDLVHTLLRKSPDARYQSAAGLALDLRALRDALDGSGNVELRGRVLGERPELPQGLVGREVEIEQLHAAFERARGGDRAVAWVTGAPGVGKTSLVHELVRAVTVAGGRLLEGKLDQLARDVPLAAFCAVLEGFAADVLAGSTDAVERWRRTLDDAVAPNGRVLVDLAPSLGALLGPQPALVELGPTQARRRLEETMRRALGAIATPDQTLVVFLDDLQWADLATLRVIEALFRDPDLAHVLLIGAWRDREVGPDHPLLPTLEAIAEVDTPTTRIDLGPLDRDQVARLLAGGLHASPDAVGGLAAPLFDKTHGNPFFLRRLFEEAAQAGAFTLDEATLTWTSDATAVDALDVAANVVDWLRGALEGLGGDARTCLSAAALLGDRFDLDGLREATGLDDDTIGAAVTAAIDGRFVDPLDDDYWTGGARRFRFAFVHDRVQQAAAELLPEDERGALHLAIARGLDARAAEASPFDVADHYAAALDQVTEPDERRRVLRWHRLAGERALDSAAHGAAHRFFGTASTLCDELDAPGEDARRVRELAARAAWLVGDADAMDAHLDRLRADARGVADRLAAEEILVQARIARADLHAALDAALAVLAEAGVPLPREPTQDDVMAAVGATLGRAGGSLEREEVDPDERARRALLVRIASAAYVAEPNLVPLIACELVQRSVDHGADAHSAYGFGLFSLVLTAGWLLEPGAAQATTALALLDRFEDRAIAGAVQHVVSHYARAWGPDGYRAIYDDNPDVYRALMDVGDLEYAGWAMHMRVVYGLLAGVELGALAEDAERAIAVMRLHDLEAALACTLPLARLIAALRDEAHDPGRLDGDGFDEEATFEALEAVEFRAASLVLSVSAQAARVYLGDPEEARRWTARAMDRHDGAVAIGYQASMRVLGAIATLDGDGAAIEGVLPWRAPLAAWAEQSPTHGGASLALFDAEIARARGELLEATRLYDRAVDLAAAGGRIHDQALALERAGLAHLDAGTERVARAYLVEARLGWERWGATAKVRQLDERHGELLAPALRRLRPNAAQSTASISVTGGQLDLESVLKASHAIAEEVELDQLLSRAMRVLLENVGARRAALLLTYRGVLRVEAHAAADGDVSLREDAERAPLPGSLVRRVWRTGEAEVHDDLGAAPGAADDPDAADGVSALCAPITLHGRPLGVVYFENDLSAGAFTADRVRVLDVLAPTLAVSIRNVRLLEAQSRFVPAQFLRSLGRDDIVDVGLGDHELKEVSILFSDIWGYTPLVEKLDASDALAFLNEYFAHAEPPITGHEGFIDSFVGDGVMALFDAPELNAQHAVTAAVEMHRGLTLFNAQRAAAGATLVRTGIGINTGRVTMSTIGGGSSLKCGVVGDAVNLASRVERLTRRTLSRLLISDQTVSRLSNPGAFGLRRAGRVRVKGRRQPLTIYEVLDAEPASIREPRLATHARYEAALDAYYAGEPTTALDAFTECVSKVPSDPLARRFLQLTETLLREGVPDGWTGIERAS